jgi:hypothetical protein
MDKIVLTNDSRKFCMCERGTSGLVRDGFVVLKGFLDRPEVARLQTAVDVLRSSPHEGACDRPHNTLLPLRWNDRIVQLLLTSERRVQVLNEAVGADDLKWISGYVSIKQAHTPPLWWHQDWWCWDHPVSYQWTAPQVATLCYLADTNLQNRSEPCQVLITEVRLYTPFFRRHTVAPRRILNQNTWLWVTCRNK